MTFSEQLVNACVKPKNYRELLDLKRGRHVAYVLVILLVLGVIGFAIPIAAVISGFGGFEKLFNESMGNVSVQGGEMQIERPFFINIRGLKIVINTEDDAVSDDRLSTEGAYIAIGKKTVRLAISGSGKVNDYATYDVSTFFPDGFNNQTLVNVIPKIYVVLVLSVLAGCFGYFVKYAFLSLVFSITVNSLNKHLELGLNFGQVFMLCFYGQSLGILISNFNSAMNFLPQMIVSLVCIFISIHMITTAVVSLKGGKNRPAI